MRNAALLSEKMLPRDLASQGFEGDALDLVALWQRTLTVSARCNERTRDQYQRRMERFVFWIFSPDRWQGAHSLFAITQDDVVDYISAIGATGPARNQSIRALRSYFSWQADRFDVSNPIRRITPKREKYGRAPNLEDPDLQAVLVAAERVDPRARWAMQLAFATGGRAGSLVNARPQDLCYPDGIPTLRFVVAKNDDPYEVPLNESAMEAIAHLLDLLEYTPRTVQHRLPTLFGVRYGAYYGWVKRAGDLAGVDVNTHLFRHAFLTRLARDPEVSQIEWAELANHKDGSLLRRYASATAPGKYAAVSRISSR